MKAFELANLVSADGTFTGKHSEGGKVDVDESQKVTGVIRERAVEPFIAALAAFKTTEQKLKFLKEGIQLCLQHGLTSVETNDEGCYDAYSQLLQENSLPIRIFLTPNCSEIKQLSQRTNGAIHLDRNPAQFAPTRLAMERIKIFSDGSLGAETAALKISEEKFKGILIHSRDSLKTMITESTNLGFRVEVHAIGDAAAEQVCNAFNDAVHELNGKPIIRPLLTHCQVLSPHAISTMKNLQMIANVQPSFVPTGIYFYLY
jgi:predicted amidohydrolase YtcJ